MVADDYVPVGVPSQVPAPVVQAQAQAPDMTPNMMERHAAFLMAMGQ